MTGEAGAAAAPAAAAIEARRRLSARFLRKGVAVALVSGVFYGLYSAFLNAGIGRGVWERWHSDGSGLAPFVSVYLLAALGSAVNDTVSAGWAVAALGARGKLGDLLPSLWSRPGRLVVVAALVGGPVASSAFVAGMQLAGSIAIPITALCPAVGALLGRAFLGQRLGARMLVGIAVCVGASVLVGSAGFGGDAPEGLVLGCAVALVAAVGWGVEGTIGGYASSVVDPEIAVAIRQLTSGLANLFLLLPLLGLVAGDPGLAPRLAVAAFASGPAMTCFAASGLFALLTYGLWYKGNSMCGTGLGMAGNGTYSFWGPFFCWLVLGVAFGQGGWTLPPVAWVGALVMCLGILTIATNPLDLLRRERDAAA